MSLTIAEIALNTALNNIPDKPPIAWQNINFTETEGVFYRPSLIMTDESPYTVDLLGQRVHDLLYRVMVFVPVNTGVGDTRGQLEALESAFYAGQTLIQDGHILRVLSTRRNTPTQTATHWVQGLDVKVVFIY